MIAAALSETLKLRERTYWVGAAGMAAFMAVSMLISVGGAAEAPSDRGPAGLILARDQLAAQDGLAVSLGNSVTFLGIAALTLIAINTGAEYGLGTVRTLLIRHPCRTTLLLGKTATLLAYLAVAVTLAAAVGAAVAFLLAPDNDVDTSAWLTTSGWIATAGGVANLILATWGWAVLGLVLAVLLRSAPAAIGAGVAYALPVEILVTAVVEEASVWLPGQVLQALARGGTPELDHTTALLRSLVWIGLAVAVAVVAFRQRELAE